MARLVASRATDQLAAAAFGAEPAGVTAATNIGLPRGRRGSLPDQFEAAKRTQAVEGKDPADSCIQPVERLAPIAPNRPEDAL